jgi:nitrogenase-stabilizing/protective protein
MPAFPRERRALYAGLLAGAYADFVNSNALTEKVFRVFHQSQPRTATVPLTELARGLPDAS